MAEQFDGQTSSYQTYIGQTSHALSEAEWDILFEEKLIFDTQIFSGDKSKMEEALREAGKTATGAAQLREIIASPRSYFYLHASSSADKQLEKRNANGLYTPDLDMVVIHSDLLDNPTNSGITLLHEMLHNRQDWSTDNPNKILMDAETQALDAQLAAEMPVGQSSDDDISYRRSYQQNCKKWHDKLSKQGYSEDVCKAYAQDMASKETRAQFIKDWIRNPKDTEHALPVTSYKSDDNRHAYKEQTEELNGESELSEEVINQMIERYKPFLKREDFNALQSENAQINREAANTNGETEDAHSQEQKAEISEEEAIKRTTDQIDSYLGKGNENTPIGQALPAIRQKILNHEELSKEEKVIQGFVSVLESDKLSKEEKEALMGTYIGLHQQQTYDPENPDATHPIRAQMIDTLSEVKTGEKGNLQIVQNETSAGLRGQLSAHSGGVLTNEVPEQQTSPLIYGSDGASIA